MNDFNIVDSVCITINDDGYFDLSMDSAPLIKYCFFFQRVTLRSYALIHSYVVYHIILDLSCGTCLFRTNLQAPPTRNTSFINLVGLILKQNYLKKCEKYLFNRFNIK